MLSRRSLFSFGACALLLASLLAVSHGLFCGSDNCYSLLGVERSATKSEIRRAYRKLSVEMHPDRNRGNEAVAAKYKLIGDAYGALKDDSRRTKYDDFLDNPGKYWDFLATNAKEVTPPKTNLLIAVTLIIGAFSLVNWLNMSFTYNSTIQRMRETPEFKREVSRLVKAGQAKNADEAEKLIDLDVVGLEEPSWENLVVVKFVRSPERFFNYLKWLALWQINYKMLKKEMTPEDKVYMIQKNLEMSPLEFERLSESAQKSLIDQELWKPEESKNYRRKERIALNKSGKLRKMKKQAARAAESGAGEEDLIE